MEKRKGDDGGTVEKSGTRTQVIFVWGTGDKICVANKVPSCQDLYLNEWIGMFFQI